MKQVPERTTRVRTNHIIATAVKSVIDQNPQNEAVIQYNPTRVVHYIHARPVQIATAVTGLLDQALHYSGNGGMVVVRQGRFRGKRHNDTGDFSKITVRLGGEWICEETLRLVSEKIAQMNASVNDGTGRPKDFALAESNTIIREHGGNMWFQCSPASGYLSFNVSLPLLKEIKISSASSACLRNVK